MDTTNFPPETDRYIECIARGIAIRDGKVLLCRAKGGNSTYLPGGHIEFGETGAEALRREVKEELGAEAEIGERLGVLENAFLQHGVRHQEINLIYRMTVEGSDDACSMEDWIEFEWCPLEKLEEANLLPKEIAQFITCR